MFLIKKSFNYVFAVILITVMVFGFSTLGQTQETLRFGAVQPRNHVYNQAIDKLTELVSEKTNGSLKIELYPDSILGSNPAMMDSVYQGALAMGQFPPGTLGEYYAPFNLFSFYFLFEDFEDMVSTLDSEAIKEMSEDFLDKTGIRVLGYAGGLERNIITRNTAIREIDDLKGLTMRAWEWSPAIKWWETLGASSSVVAYSEVYTGLQTGVVDGAENEFSAFDTDGWAEISNYIARTQHIFTIRPIVINNDIFEGLTESQQTALLEATKEAQDYQMELSKKQNEELAEKMKTEYNIEITHPNKESFIERSQKLLIEFAPQYGFEDIIEELFGLEVE